MLSKLFFSLAYFGAAAMLWNPLIDIEGAKILGSLFGGLVALSLFEEFYYAKEEKEKKETELLKLKEEMGEVRI